MHIILLFLFICFCVGILNALFSVSCIVGMVICKGLKYLLPAALIVIVIAWLVK